MQQSELSNTFDMGMAQRGSTSSLSPSFSMPISPSVLVSLVFSAVHWSNFSPFWHRRLSCSFLAHIRSSLAVNTLSTPSVNPKRPCSLWARRKSLSFCILSNIRASWWVMSNRLTNYSLKFPSFARWYSDTFFLFFKRPWHSSNNLIIIDTAWYSCLVWILALSQNTMAAFTTVTADSLLSSSDQYGDKRVVIIADNYWATCYQWCPGTCVPLNKFL